MSSSAPSAAEAAAEAAALYQVLSGTIGSLEMGVLISAVLYGVYVLQAWNYYRYYPNDPTWMKALVGAIALLDTFHTALTFHALWWYTIVLFGQTGQLGYTYWTLSSSIYPAGLGVFLTQAFFCYRVWKVTQSWIGTAVCFILSVGRWGFSISSATMALKLGSFVLLNEDYRWGVVCTLVVGAAADIAIAVALCGTLIRSRTAFSSTDRMLDKLVAFTISTGLLSSLIAIAEVICFLSVSNLIWLALLVILMKMFPNCLLASLNERSNLRSMAKTNQSYMSKPDGRLTEYSRGGHNTIELTTEISVARDPEIARKTPHDEDSDFGYDSTPNGMFKA